VFPEPRRLEAWSLSSALSRSFRAGSLRRPTPQDVVAPEVTAAKEFMTLYSDLRGCTAALGTCLNWLQPH